MPADGVTEPAADVLETLWLTIGRRRGADPRTSYSASLLAGHPIEPAKKLAEEAAEAAMEAVAGRPDGLARESADLLYHLLVLLAGAAVPVERVLGELAARERASARSTKARHAGSRKIP